MSLTKLSSCQRCTPQQFPEWNTLYQNMKIPTAPTEHVSSCPWILEHGQASLHPAVQGNGCLDLAKSNQTCPRFLNDDYRCEPVNTMCGVISKTVGFTCVYNFGRMHSKRGASNQDPSNPHSQRMLSVWEPVAATRTEPGAASLFQFIAEQRRFKLLR